ncbi:MAG: Mur ligase domain-containing protein, partial [candidate division WOR-3 bacterium]
MKEIELEKAIEAMKGKYLGNDSLKGRSLSGVSVDSRTIKKGEMFFALKGENFDGHDFVQDALNKGAVGVMVSQEQQIDQPQIVVGDTLQALGQLAAVWRN